MGNKEKLATEKIWRLLLKYSLPSVVAMLVNGIYNIVDRYFIGEYVGEYALAGVTVSYPISISLFSLASLVAIGSSTLTSIKLGEKDEDSVINIFSIAIILIFLNYLLMFIFVFPNLQNILYFFGSDNSTINYSLNYSKIIIVTSIFQMYSYLCNNIIRAKGNPIIPMIALISAATTNIVLDYIFIAKFNMGVEGAAIATGIAKFVSLTILLTYLIKSKTKVRVGLQVFNLNLIKKICIVGIPSFIATLGISITMALLNRMALIYGGTVAVVSIGAINSIMTLIHMPLIGVQQGVQPIVGYNYGAKKIDRCFEALSKALIITFVFAFIPFLIIQFNPKFLLSIFIEETSSTMNVAINGIKIFFAMLPLININMLGVGFFQAVGRGKEAIVLGMLRQIVFLLPLLFILPKFYGLNGVWFAVPVSDFLSILLVGIALYLERKKYEN